MNLDDDLKNLLREFEQKVNFKDSRFYECLSGIIIFDI